MLQSRTAQLNLQNIREVRPDPVQSITGTIEIVTTQSPDTGWGVYKVRLDGEHGNRLVAVLGNGGDLKAGVYISADGRWSNHDRFGDQFKADVIRVTPPSSVEGILRYLSSGMIHGIGKKKAAAIVGVFGAETLHIMEHQPKRLLEVPGVGCALMDIVVQSWGENSDLRQLLVFLQNYGIPTSKVGAINKKYGSQSISRISADPYALARDISGIGFLTADRVASELRIPPHSLKRVAAGLIHTLETLKDEGHSAGPREIVLKKASAMLKLDLGIVEDALDHLVSLGELEEEQVRGRALIYLPYMRAYERSVATILLRLCGPGETLTRSIDFESVLARAELTTKKTLSDSQRQALQAALRNRVQVITGGPGAGKSTILFTFLEMLEGSGLRVVQCAPTGRAAKRMVELTGRESKTIHRLLEFRPQNGDFARNHRNPMEGDVFIVDESSMLDLALAYKFLRALPKHAHLLLVGDVDQLPSVGAGSVLADIIQSGVVPVVWLREIFRQAAQSRIIVNAHAINRGELPITANEADDDFFFIKLKEADEVKAMMIRMITERIPAKFKLDPLKDVQVLAPMHKGALGVGELNRVLQHALNAKNLNGPKHTSLNGSVDYFIGDKVMQLKNDYDLEVFNGDMGFIRAIGTPEDARMAIIEFDDRQVQYPLGKFGELSLAYVCSIHKSQGSEWPAVVMPMSRSYFHMLQKNLIYTGITRGKKLVLMIGDKSALAIACKNNKANERFGGLQKRLSEHADDWLDESLFPE